MPKVIFIDDENATLKLLSKIIPWQDEGFTIEGVATDGKEGIELYKRVHPDLIIVDIVMPIMDGIEFIREIRKRDKKVRIIILSAYSEFEYAQKAIPYDISDYLLKPLDENKLLQIIRKLYKTINTETMDEEGYNRLKSKLDDITYMSILKRIANFVLYKKDNYDCCLDELSGILFRPGFEHYFIVYVKTMRCQNPS